jgi:GNAT superfamily N-acetyltransferase
MIQALTADHLDDIAGLLASRHREHRRHSPLLDPGYEDASVCAEVLGEQLAHGATGVVALDGGRVVGYLLGRPGEGPSWGPNVWMDSTAICAPDAETVRDLYAAAAQVWVDDGKVAHYVLVPASRPDLVDGFFRLGFGLQHVHALREPAPAPPIPDDVTIRRAERGDVPALARLDRELPLHQGRAPVFSASEPSTQAEAEQEWSDDFDDDRFATFVAAVDGEVLASAIGCPLALSSLHKALVLADHAGFLGFAAVLPSARGRGLGRTLGDTVIGWAHESGYRSVATDWRATNLLSSRTWPRLGFEPTFLRLHRLVGY